MFDWLWRGLGYTLKKDIRKQYIDKKMLEDSIKYMNEKYKL